MAGSPQRVLEPVEDPRPAGSQPGLAGGRREGLERLPLLPGQLRGDLDVDQDVQVAACSRPPEVRSAATAQPDLRARLGPRLDLEILLAVRRRDADGRAKRRLGDREREVAEELRPFALQRRVRRDVDRDIEAAGRATARTHLALCQETDLVPVVDPCRHADAEPFRALAPAVAAAVRTGCLHDLALPAAARTGDDVHHLAQHRLADVADLAATLALRAGDGRRAVLRAAPRAGGAAVEHRELDLLLGAADRLLEADAQVVAGGGPPPPRPAAARGRAAEERVEEVGEAAE